MTGHRSGAPSARVRVRRVPENAVYDRAAVDAVLDEAVVAHLGLVQDGQPFVIPVLHARAGDEVLVHGSSASRAFRTLASGAPGCLTVTLLDGLVLARSVYEHSANYRSVVVLGVAREVTGPEKLRALEALTERLLPGRWAEARRPSDAELRATCVLAFPLDEASAKVRTGPPDDADSPDGALDVWAGVIPCETRWLPPVPDPELRPGIPLPPSARRYRR